MAIKLAIIGLEPVHQEWLEAAGKLRGAGEVEIVGVGHRSMAAARAAAEFFEGDAPVAYDDLRRLMQESAPQVLLMDRPANATREFIHACFAQNVGIFSLGPIVENLSEAHALAEMLEPRTHLLYTWPRMADSYAYRHCAQADDFVRPIRFVAGRWMGMNYPLAKTAHAENAGAGAVRSLSVLAWDALATLIHLLDVPSTVYAAIRGTAAADDRFTDISGAASITLQFPEDRAASLTLCDRMAGPMERDVLLLGQGGTVKLEPDNYEFRDPDGKLIDAGRVDAILAGSGAVETLREFLRHFTAPPSPARGWKHNLVEIAATMEALVVSHRTGQAESPEAFRRLRR